MFTGSTSLCWDGGGGGGGEGKNQNRPTSSNSDSSDESDDDVLPHMRMLAHTRIGRPIRVWGIPYTRMGHSIAPYAYGRPI